MRNVVLGLVGTAVVAAVVALAVTGYPFSTGSAVPAAAASGHEEGGISVVGEGRVLAEPTQARAVFGVEVVDASLSTAQQQAAAQMDRVINRLLELGIEQRDIQTVGFNVQPQFDHETRPPAVTGYRVSNSVAVTLRDIDAVGPTIDAVVEAGAVRVDGIGFEVGDPTALKDQAREQAMAHARSKAEHLARLAGVGVGRPIRIEESDTDGPPVPFPAAPRAAVEADTPIAPGEVEVRTQVRVVYAIQ